MNQRLQLERPSPHLNILRIGQSYSVGDGELLDAHPKPHGVLGHFSTNGRSGNALLWSADVPEAHGRQAARLLDEVTKERGTLAQTPGGRHSRQGLVQCSAVQVYS